MADSAKEKLPDSISHTIRDIPNTLDAHSHAFSIDQKHSSSSPTRRIVKRVDGFATADNSARLVNGDTKVTSKEFIFTLSMTTEDLFPSETDSVVSKSLFPVFTTDMLHRPETLTLTDTFEPIPTATFHIPKSITVPTIIIPRPSATSSMTTLSSILLPKATASSTTVPNLMDSDSEPDMDTPSKGEIASIVLGVIATLLSIVILSYLCNRCAARYKKRTGPKPLNTQLKGFPYPDPRLSRSYTVIPSPRDSQNEHLPQTKFDATAFNSKSLQQRGYASSNPLANERFPDLARYAAIQDNTLAPSDAGAVACEPIRPKRNYEGLNYMSRYSSSEYSQDGDRRSIVESPWKHKT